MQGLRLVDRLVAVSPRYPPSAVLVVLQGVFRRGKTLDSDGAFIILTAQVMVPHFQVGEFQREVGDVLQARNIYHLVFCGRGKNRCQIHYRPALTRTYYIINIHMSEKPSVSIAPAQI